MMDPIGEYWYALKKTSNDPPTEEKEEYKVMMSNLFADWKPTQADETSVVVSHADIKNKPTITGFVRGQALTIEPSRSNWVVKELTKEEKQKKKKTTKTSAHTNVYTYYHNWFDMTQHQTHYPLRSLSREDKKSAAVDCQDRFTPFQAASFAQMLSDQHRILLEFRKRAMELTGEDFCPRNGWEQWPPVPHGDRMYGWMICVLCITTSNSPDDRCKAIVQEILNRFPDPFEIALYPERAMDFLCSKCKGYQSSGDPKAGQMKNGMNFGFTKAMYIVIMTKQVVLYWAKQHMNEWVRPDCDEYYCKPSVKNNETDSWEGGTWQRPFPPYVIDEARNASTSLLPAEFDFKFFIGLFGIGLKMASLIAEAVFLTPYGPAVDRHLIRLFVECNLVPASESDQYIHDFCRKAYANHAPTVFTLMNEVPGMIGQVSRKNKYKKPIQNMFEVEELRKELYKKLIGAAAANGYGQSFPFFLRGYMKYPLKATPTDDSGNDGRAKSAKA